MLTHPSKASNAKLVGEKGVGLKYVIFSSQRFELETCGSQGACSIEIEGAASWVESNSSDELLLSHKESSKADRGTRLKIVMAAKDNPIFNFNPKELSFILRTKTALGDTGFLWKEELPITASVTHVDLAGKKTSEKFGCRYLLPVDGIKQGNILDIDDYKNWLSQGPDRSDLEKRKKLMDKVLVRVGEEHKSGRDIKFWSCFVPKREWWKDLSKAAGLLVKDSDGESDIEEGSATFHAEFVTSTKGMPTGIRLAMKQGGDAGYHANFFIIVEDPGLSFDIGRKSIPGRQQGMLRDLAHSQFREYVNVAMKYLAGSSRDSDPEYDRDEAFGTIAGFPDLNSSASRFLKRPNGQESMVAALFFEQIGKGEFPGLIPVYSAYKDRYDLYANWEKKRQIIEFKYDLKGLFANFDETTKMFSEINVVVVWEVTEHDLKSAVKKTISVESVSEAAFSSSKVKRFPGVTKELVYGLNKSIQVVEMKRVLGQ